MINEVIEAFLPQGLLKHFNIKKIKECIDEREKEKFFELYLEEKNELPAGYLKEDYESKGFYESKRIQDFPIRGNAFYLVIKRRRWRHKKTKEIIKSDFSFIATGVKLTEELSNFLKGTGRNPSRYG